jgi:hypothetical protein
VIERLRPRLRTFQDEKGRELLDVPGGLFPDPETVAPPRFLPDFDNALLSHDDRSRILDFGYHGATVTEIARRAGVGTPAIYRMRLAVQADHALTRLCWNAGWKVFSFSTSSPRVRRRKR